MKDGFVRCASATVDIKVAETDYNTSNIIKAIEDAARETGAIVTCENHNVYGGLGSAVAEVVIEAGKACAFRKLGLQDKFSKIGLHEDLMAMHEIDAEGIVKNALEVINQDFEKEGVKGSAVKAESAKAGAAVKLAPQGANWVDEV